MKQVANRNNGAYEEANESSIGDTCNALGVGFPDGTHPSDYSKGKKANDMSASKSDGNLGYNNR